MVEVMKIMVTSFKRFHASTAELSAAVHEWDLLKEVTFIFISSTIVWPQVKQQGGKSVLPINRKLD